MAPIGSVTFERTLELARAALAGVECVTIALQYGLPMPAAQLVAMIAAVETARRELNELEQTAYGAPRGLQ